MPPVLILGLLGLTDAWPSEVQQYDTVGLTNWQVGRQKRKTLKTRKTLVLNRLKTERKNLKTDN
jgi:hypothetical protein